jgi:acetylornithine deacetylase
MGLEVDVFEADVKELRKHPEYTAVEYSEKHGYKGRPNVAGKWKGSGGGKSVILTGHIDVVPAGDRKLWKHDPLKGEIEGGRIYGRGVACNKGGITIDAMSVACLQAAGVKLKGDVTLVSSIEDEVGSAGGQLAMVLKGYKADGGLYPHPNIGGLGGVLLASAGMLFFKVKTGGVMDEFPENGVNAIGNMFKVYQGLSELHEKRGRRIRYKGIERFFAAGGWPPASIRTTNIIPAIISGGEDLIQVPGHCELACSISYPPGEDRASVKAEVEDCIKRVAGADFWMKDNPPTVEWYAAMSPSEVAPDFPLVQILKSKVKEFKGIDPEDRGIPMFCDFRFLTNYAGTPQIMIGPKAGLLHGFDEWVDLEEFFDTIKIVSLTIAEWCGVEA